MLVRTIGALLALSLALPAAAQGIPKAQSPEEVGFVASRLKRLSDRLETRQLVEDEVHVGERRAIGAHGRRSDARMEASSLPHRARRGILIAPAWRAGRHSAGASARLLACVSPALRSTRG